MTNARSSKLAAFVLFIIGGATVLSQTVTPPIAEFRGIKAENSFRVDNSTGQPLMVTLEVKSFTVSKEGKVVVSPLPSTVHADIGSSSFVIPPNDSHTVYYKIVSTVSPTTVTVMPTMTPMGKARGMRVNFCIPHMVYLYQKAKLVKSDVKVAMRDNKVVIENTSEKLGRVKFIHVGSDDLDGFPLYPGQTREIPVASSKATVHFEDGFKVDAR